MTVQSPKSVRIDTARLYLRPLQRSDCTETYLGWLLDPEVNQYLDVRNSSQSSASIIQYVERLNSSSNEHLFGIFLRDGERHIGNIKIGPIGNTHPVSELTLMIGDRQAWGRGLGTEAIRAASRYTMDTLGVRKLVAGMFAANQASYKAFINAGFEHEGMRRKHYLLDGVMSDVLLVGMTEDNLT